MTLAATDESRRLQRRSVGCLRVQRCADDQRRRRAVASSRRAFQQVDGVAVSITQLMSSARKPLFGMTRTGKSNTTKIVLKTIFELRWQPAALRIGQVIFDPNGESANENAQDAGERRRDVAKLAPDRPKAERLPTGDN